MTLTLTDQTTVRDVIVRYPQTRGVLERFGIDYCCGGGAPLKEAARESGADLKAVVAALEEALETPAPAAAERDWSGATLTELADHIVSRHHAFLKRELPRVEGLLARVQKAHGARHGDMLKALGHTFAGLKEEIEGHLFKEENILFPFIRQLDAYAALGGERPQICCGHVEGPIHQMQAEHESAGGALAQMRDTTLDYTVPPDGCPTFHALFDGLRALEADLHEHIHLENNILFPRTMEMEAKV